MLFILVTAACHRYISACVKFITYCGYIAYCGDTSLVWLDIEVGIVSRSDVLVVPVCYYFVLFRWGLDIRPSSGLPFDYIPNTCSGRGLGRPPWVLGCVSLIVARASMVG